MTVLLSRITQIIVITMFSSSVVFSQSKERGDRVLLVNQEGKVHFPALKDLVFAYKDSPPGRAICQELEKKGFHKVLLLGGSMLNSLFYKEKLVDELMLTIAPVLLANKGAIGLIEPHLDQPIQMTLINSAVDQNHLFLTYQVQK